MRDVETYLDTSLSLYKCFLLASSSLVPLAGICECVESIEAIDVREARGRVVEDVP